MLFTISRLVLILGAGCSALQASTQALSVGKQDTFFDGIASTLPGGWDVRTGSTASALGSVATYVTTASAWADTDGGFKNFASSAGLSSAASSTDQSASTNRSLGIRQTETFGDPGASFNFNFSSNSLMVSSITIDLEMLSVQTRSTTWSIQYGIGTNPTSFTTLASYADPGVFGASNYSFTAADFGTNLDNQSQVWFRIAALSASTGSDKRDTFAINNFSITAIPESSVVGLAFVGLLTGLRRRRVS